MRPGDADRTLGAIGSPVLAPGHRDMGINPFRAVEPQPRCRGAIIASGQVGQMQQMNEICDARRDRCSFWTATRRGVAPIATEDDNIIILGVFEVRARGQWHSVLSVLFF